MVSTFKWFSSVFEGKVNIGSLVAFRIMFGFLSAIELVRYVFLGWVDKYFSPDQLHFNYVGFSWVVPPPGLGMHLIFLVAAACAIGIACGWCYRITSVLFSLLFSYIFLIDKANYQNHFYLILLLSLVLILMPAHAAFSYDAKHRPIIATDHAPKWCLWILRFQFAIIFLFTAIARVDIHWAVYGGEAPSWFNQFIDSLKPTISMLGDDDVLDSVYWGLIALDLATFIGLMWRVTRIYTVLFIIGTNLARATYFDLGVQPWLLIASSLLFLRPEWPHFYRRLWPAYDDRILPQILNHKPVYRNFIATVAILAYVGFQLTLPLRHLAYPTELDWSQESSRFSWGIRPKNRFGDVKIYVASSIYQKKTRINLRHYLSEHQIRTMRVWPDLVHDFAFVLRRYYKKQGHQSISVYASVSYSIDGQNFQLLTNPDVNLLAYPRSFLSQQPWMVKTPILLQKKSG